MAKDKYIFYNAPCNIWSGFLNSDVDKRDVLNHHLWCAVADEYSTLNTIPDDEERWQQACNNLCCCVANKEGCLQYGEHNNGRGYAIFSIERRMYWEFVEKFKTKEECTLLLAYLALKSIIGAKPYMKCNNALWMARMDGRNRPEYELKKGKKILILSDEMAKWNTMYGARRLKELLWKYYHVSFYSEHVRGFYFSTSMTLEKLIAEVSVATPQKTLHNEYREALQRAKNNAKNVPKSAQYTDNINAT